MSSVLLAEHHVPTGERVRELLTQAGHQVHWVREAGQALELLASAAPAVAVVAVDLPRLNGEHLGKLIRALPGGARLPIVALDKGHLGKAKGVAGILDIQANAYVADALKSKDLLAKLQAVVQTARPEAPPLRTIFDRPPASSGDLADLPLPRVLLRLHRLRASGVLVAVHQDLTRRVFFARGSPVNYDSTARQDALAPYLLEQSLATERQAEALGEALRDGARVGTALAEAGVNLAGEELLRVLAGYARLKIAQVVGMRHGRFAFHPGDEFLKAVASVEIPALAPILDGARQTFPLKAFAAPLRPFLARYPQRGPAFAQDLTALGLSNADLKIAMQMNGRIQLKELIAHGRGELSETYSLLWFLELAGDLVFATAPVAASADKLLPKRPKPLPAEELGKLREAAVRIITGSYFQVLGLDITADSPAVERAYREVSQRFHPDSYPDHDTSEIRDLLASVQDKLSASHRVLSSDEKRKAYLSYLLSRLEVGRSDHINVDAEIELKRGEAALKRRDAPSALRAFERAVSLNPREPEYYCHMAWATYLAGRSDKKARAKEALKLLRKALAMNRYLERAIVISAIIEGETGDERGARRKLLQVLEQNPHSRLAKAALLKVGR